MKKILIGLGIVLIVLVGIGLIKKAHQNGGTSSSGQRDLELSYLKTAVDPSLFPYAAIEIAGMENIATSSDQDRPYLMLSLHPGQAQKNNGTRSEVSVDYPYTEGATVKYSWQFRLPTDFTPDPQNRWWVVADWHVQPDLTKGETWDDVVPTSQPVIIGYGNINHQDILSLTLGAGTPGGGVVVGTVPFSRGVWHTVTMVIHWSEKNDGSAALYFDGSKAPVLSGKGITMLNAYQHYMKIGMYRNPAIATDNSIDIRGVTITTL